MALYSVTIRYEFTTEVEADDEDEALEEGRDAAEEVLDVAIDDLVEMDIQCIELEESEDLDEEEEDDEEDEEEPENSGVFPLDEEAEALIAQIKPE